MYVQRRRNGRDMKSESRKKLSVWESIDALLLLLLGRETVSSSKSEEKRKRGWRCRGWPTVISARSRLRGEAAPRVQ